MQEGLIEVVENKEAPHCLIATAEVGEGEGISNWHSLAY